MFVSSDYGQTAKTAKTDKLRQLSPAPFSEIFIRNKNTHACSYFTKK